jgi:hypothetical protein
MDTTIFGFATLVTADLIECSIGDDGLIATYAPRPASTRLRLSAVRDPGGGAERLHDVGRVMDQLRQQHPGAMQLTECNEGWGTLSGDPGRPRRRASQRDPCRWPGALL